MNNMFKSLIVAASLFAAVMVNAADSASVGVAAGYNNNYIVNGVVRADASAFINVDASKSLKYADVYLGGVLLPNNELDQSHWTLGVGKAIGITDSFAARVDAYATRHQSGAAGIPNSTETGLKLAVTNPWITPYVRGSYDYNLDQTGVAAGLYREQALPWGFKVTPLAEYGKYTDYDVFVGKVSLTRPFDTAIGTVTPFADVSYVDNNFDVRNYNFATRQLNGDVVVSAGLSLKF